MGQRGKLKLYALLNRKRTKMFKYTRCVCVLWESVTGNDSGKCVLDVLQLIDIFVCSTRTWSAKKSCFIIFVHRNGYYSRLYVGAASALQNQHNND